MKNLYSLFVITSLILLTGASCTVKNDSTDEKAKYIFLFIGDGMGATHVAVAESYLSYKEGKLGGAELTFTQFPYYGTATTHSADRHITCSSASGTAIACGEKANNGTVGINKDSVEIKSFAYDLKEEGYKIGILSSVSINHATPASFYAHSHSRSDYYNISRQIASSGFDLFAADGFLDRTGKENDLMPIDDYLEENGYAVFYGLNEFTKEAPSHGQVVFCQASNRGEDADNYVSDGKEETDASISEIVQMSIDYLGDEDPFFIMCEGGTIDWAGHANRTMSTVNDIIEFDKAVNVAYEFYKNHPEETLIIVTADHETGGITLGSYSSTIDWKILEDEWLGSNKKDVLDEESNKELNHKASIGWTTTGHTGGPVPVFAIGKGAEKFNGRIDNTEIKGKILGK